MVDCFIACCAKISKVLYFDGVREGGLSVERLIERLVQSTVMADVAARLFSWECFSRWCNNVCVRSGSMAGSRLPRAYPLLLSREPQ